MTHRSLAKAREAIATLPDLLDFRAEHDPGRWAVHADGFASLTFKQLREQSHEVARSLVDAGLRPGDRVGLYGDGTPDFLVWMFGCWIAGCAVVPSNGGMTATEVAHSLDDSGARLLVAEPEKFEVISSDDRVSVPVWELGLGSSRNGALPTPSTVPPGVPDDCLVLYTSGTTGQPKGALRSHSSTILTMQNQARGLAKDPGPLSAERGASSPNIVCLPIANTGGFFAAAFAIWAGRPMVIMKKFVPERFCGLTHEYSPTHIFMTPTMFIMLLQLDSENSLASSVRFGMCGGAPLPSSLAQRFEARFGVPIIQVYGQTESGFIAGGDPRDIGTDGWRPGAIGRPYPGVELSIRADDGSEVETGAVGEVHVRSAGLIDSYLNRPEASSELKLEDGWLVTGDLGYVDAEGYLFLVGRSREMLISGGFNIYPAELEAAISEHPEVDLVAVFGEPDDRLGEKPHAAFTRCPGSSLSAEDLLVFARKRLARWKAPRTVTRLDVMPMVANGKIGRSQLPEAVLDASDSAPADRSS
ncbi:class I adenylate-forming enzyme family protein [Specibacter sp. RAF43]|uniref:class I adenylate-forming enzyme family protein n=1 Tax=Specibacter sp. RAF43 TaxID=3233057 RepID=UPI003F95A4F2